MRVVEYRIQNEDTFIKYIDIGYCERNFSFLCLYVPVEQENSSGKKQYSYYSEWFSEFKSNEMGSQMLTLNYYLSEYNEEIGNLKIRSVSNSFIALYGEKINQIIKNNYDLFVMFNDKWFNEPSLFTGLDLGWPDDIGEQVDMVEEVEDGIKSIVTFIDGSILKFLDNDDTICSFYVKEKDFDLLKEELENIVNKFE